MRNNFKKMIYAIRIIMYLTNKPINSQNTSLDNTSLQNISLLNISMLPREIIAIIVEYCDTRTIQSIYVAGYDLRGMLSRRRCWIIGDPVCLPPYGCLMATAAGYMDYARQQLRVQSERRLHTQEFYIYGPGLCIIDADSELTPKVLHIMTHTNILIHSEFYLKNLEGSVIIRYSGKKIQITKRLYSGSGYDYVNISINSRHIQ